MKQACLTVLRTVFALVVLGQGLLGQTRGALVLGVGFTESEKPALSVSYMHRVGPLKIYGVGGLGFFHPGTQVSQGKDPSVYFASTSQLFAGIQFGDMLFVAPRISYNWYGAYNSLGWGISGGFAFRAVPKLSLGLVAAHDRVRFNESADPYGPSPFTSISFVARFWLVP